MIEQVVNQMVRTSQAIVAVVGARVFYAEMPGKPIDAQPPALVVQRGSRQSRHHLKGASGVAYGFVRVTAVAPTYLGATDLAELVRNRLDGFRGDVTIGGENGQTLRVGYLKLTSQDDITSEHRDGQENLMTHGVQLDFNYQHTESIPTLE